MIATNRVLLLIVVSILIFAKVSSKPSMDALNETGNNFPSCVNTYGEEKFDVIKQNSDSLRDSIDFTDSILSPNNLFNIVWTESMLEDAPPIIDNDLNNVPDFIDSVAYYLDFAYHCQIDSLGLNSPIFIVDENGDTNKHIITVFIYDIDNIYGYYQSGEGFLALDNDFQSPSFKSKGYDGIKVTTMHEFHHAVQHMGYEKSQSTKYMEATATYMEYRFHRDIRDYLQYIDGNYDVRQGLNLNSGIFSTQVSLQKEAYEYANLFHMLYEVYGDTIIKSYYKHLYNPVEMTNYIYSDSDIQALDLALIEQSSSIESEFIRYGKWIYAATTKYDWPSFEDRDFYPSMAFEETTALYTEGDFASQTYGMYPYSLRYSRFIFKGRNSQTNDTIDVMHFDLAYDSATVSTSKRVQFNPILKISTEPSNGSRSIMDGRYFVEVENTPGFDSLVIVERPGVITSALQYSFPSPFSRTQNTDLFFRLDESAELYGEYQVEVMDPNMNVISAFQGFVEAIRVNGESYRVIRHPSPQNSLTRPGVYIYRVVLPEDKVVLGKIAVVE